MDFTTLFLAAYLAAFGLFITLLIVFSIIEKGRDKYKMQP